MGNGIGPVITAERYNPVFDFPSYHFGMRNSPTPKLEIDLETLLAERHKLASAILSTSTVRDYRYDWLMFERWCQQTGLNALPAEPNTVTLFAVGELRRGMKVTTVRRRLAAIAQKHVAAGHGSPLTRDTIDMLRVARRLRAEQPAQVLPLSVDLVRRMSIALRELATDVAIRNRAILVLGLASGLRSANLAALMLRDVTPFGEHLVLQIRREKQDKESRGRQIGLPRGKHPDTCPVRVLNAWLEIRGREPGPLFWRLNSRDTGIALVPEHFCKIVKTSLALIGVDPHGYGSHSLRAGLVTEAGESGAGELVIAAQTGHRDMKVLRQYFRRQNLFRSNVAAMIGL